MGYLKKNYPDSYNFIRSLEDEKNDLHDKLMSTHFLVDLVSENDVKVEKVISQFYEIEACKRYEMVYFFSEIKYTI